MIQLKEFERITENLFNFKWKLLSSFSHRIMCWNAIVTLLERLCYKRVKYKRMLIDNIIKINVGYKLSFDCVFN